MAAKEGKALTFQTLRTILEEECENNISMDINRGTESDTNGLEVSGRGELQLAILAEKIRRKGFELAISSPRVLCKTDQDGRKLEPIECVHVEADTKYCGLIMDTIVRRKGAIKRVSESAERIKIEFSCSTRGLIGMSSVLRHETKGTAVMSRTFEGVAEVTGMIESCRKGSITSMTDGICTSYALGELEDRGKFFVRPGSSVYSGMVIGEATKGDDLDVNPCRQKTINGARSVIKDEIIRLAPAMEMTVEEYLAYMEPDEILEITPKTVRLRNAILNASQRRHAKKKVLL
jgi:GTP-binding protein